MDDKNLIFLISQPRAGSTLLQRILAGHPDIHSTEEPWVMLPPIYALKPKGSITEYNNVMAFIALQDFLKTLANGEQTYFTALQKFGLSLYGSACNQANKSIFLDKTPRYYLIIPELLRIFPHAKFIILLRNPLSILSSIIQTWVKGNWLLLQDYYLDLILAPSKLAEALTAKNANIISTHYEAIVQKPTESIMALCTQLDITFHSEMINYGEKKFPLGRLGDPTGINRHNTPTTSRLNSWLSLGEARQTRYLAEYYLNTLGEPLLSTLGYSPLLLKTKLKEVPQKYSHFIIPWKLIFKPRKSILEKLLLVILSSLQQKKPVYSHQQISHLLRKHISLSSR